MWRRWIIRSLFMLPVLLCVVGWVRSGWRYDLLSYSHSGQSVICGSSEGILFVSGERFVADPLKDTDPPDDGWWCISNRRDTVQFWPIFDPRFDFPSFLGFGYSVYDHPPDWSYTLCVPYWFLIVIFSPVLFFVWRKTRPKPKSKTAFPVEVTTPS